jgi:methylthioribose-1-phosphate isomerase
MAVKTIEYIDDNVVLIDQTKLPVKEVYATCKTYKDVGKAIKNMLIRGAPAIGVAAAMGIALGAQDIKARDFDGFKKEIDKICAYLGGTRPTAVNLFWAIGRMKKLLDDNSKKTVPQLKNILKAESKKILQEDIRICKKIGINSGGLIAEEDTILTHCNAGALATGGYGTALGVIRAAHGSKKRIQVFACETRPFLQGARLTAWELMQDNIPVTLITDNMAGYFMKKGMIDKIVVGADRIASNGDTANKIGTYSLSVLAKEHKIPFYIAAPVSTFDFSANTGDDIPIEERDAKEVTHVFGKRIAPDNVGVRNPAFDVTPNKYITAIITEQGIVRKPFTESIMELKR